MIYLLVFLLVLLGGLIWGLLAIRSFHQKRKPFELLAEQMGLELSYSSAIEFMLRGRYRGYPVTALAVQEETKDGSQAVLYKASIPMINPQEKMLLVYTGKDRYSTRIDESRKIPLQETFAPPIQAFTNDLLFSSFVLTEPIRMKIEKVCSTFSDAGLFISEDELTFLANTQKEADSIQTLLDLLADIKDSLNNGGN